MCFLGSLTKMEREKEREPQCWPKEPKKHRDRERVQCHGTPNNCVQLCVGLWSCAETTAVAEQSQSPKRGTCPSDIGGHLNAGTRMWRELNDVSYERHMLNSSTK